MRLRILTVGVALTCGAAVISTPATAPAAAMPPLPTGGLIEIDCSQGPVDIGEISGQYVLKGRCSTVTVRNSYTHVYLEYADRLVLRMDNGSAHADDLGKLIIDGTHLDVGVSGRIGKLRVARGAAIDIRAGTGKRAVLAGQSTRLRYQRLSRLVVRGQSNKVVVRKGRTKVTDTGRRSIIRVSRR